MKIGEKVVCAECWNGWRRPNNKNAGRCLKKLEYRGATTPQAMPEQSRRSKSKRRPLDGFRSRKDSWRRVDSCFCSGNCPHKMGKLMEGLPIQCSSHSDCTGKKRLCTMYYREFRRYANRSRKEGPNFMSVTGHRGNCPSH